jgi:prephenate dehydratase
MTEENTPSVPSMPGQQSSQRPLILGVSGMEGSFSEEAGLLYAHQKGWNAKIDHNLDMEGVLRALNNDEIDYGIFPVVNSIGGLVETAFLAMGMYKFEMLDKFPFLVNQCVLTLPNVKKKEIQQVTSHPQALAQCQNYLGRKYPKCHRVVWSDTASAARDLASGKLPRFSAVLASPRAAEIYNLKIVKKGVQDQNPNLTTFILVKKRT